MTDAKVVAFQSKSRASRRRPVVPEDMPDVACPFCGSGETEADGIYGCHMMLAQYYCRKCKSAFDWVRGD